MVLKALEHDRSNLRRKLVARSETLTIEDVRYLQGQEDAYKVVDSLAIRELHKAEEEMSKEE